MQAAETDAPYRVSPPSPQPDADEKRPLRVRESGLRLHTPTGNEPSPFLKWAGGKTQLLPQLERFFPSRIARYHEPFLGGGAVFFFLRGRGYLTGDVFLSDVNRELINAYEAVRDCSDDLLGLLESHKRAHHADPKTHYYAVRARSFLPGVVGAARTLYLNKTCFNGLYRVNRKNEFNTPMGSYQTPSIYDEAALRRASVALAGVQLRHQGFEKSLAACTGPNDLFYLDPPYVPVSQTASFTAYVPGGWGQTEQETLAQTVRQAIHGRGGYFVLSNSWVPSVCEWYAGFRIEQASAKRMINCDGARRGSVDEAIVLNFRRDETGLSPLPPLRSGKGEPV